MQDLQRLLGYSFKDPSFLELALTHASAAGNKKSYERLEFLGDRILSLAVADMLYKAFPEEEEGALAKRHSALVKQAALERIAEKIDLVRFIRVASKETTVSGSMVSDVLEAILAAIYLDSGFTTAEKCVQRFWAEALHQEVTPPEDSKSTLQEWAQARGHALPEYRLVEQSGPDHRPTFVVEASLAGYPATRGEGSSKQMAEKAAARALITLLREHHEFQK